MSTRPNELAAACQYVVDCLPTKPKGLEILRKRCRIALASSPWITDSLPDADLTVLMRTSDPEYPVWPGFHDGETWRTCDASTIEGIVQGWMNLEDAAAQLTWRAPR